MGRKQCSLTNEKNVHSVLKARPGRPMTPKDITLALKNMFPALYQEKLVDSGKTEDAFINDTVTLLCNKREAIAKSNDNIDLLRSETPRKLVWINDTDNHVPSDDMSSEDETVDSKNDIFEHSTATLPSEKSTYATLIKCLSSEFDLTTCMRIDEKRTRKGKRNDNRWRHPDIVGCHNPTENYSTLLRQCARKVNGNDLSLYSFEVKLDIGNTGTRSYQEIASQALFNSGWANYAYLVITTLNAGSVESDLRYLNQRFGLGVYLLDLDEPDNSRVLFSASRADKVYFDFVERMANVNLDFEAFCEEIVK